MKKKEANQEKEKKKVVGWSTNMLKEDRSKRELEDTTESLSEGQGRGGQEGCIKSAW